MAGTFSKPGPLFVLLLVFRTESCVVRTSIFAKFGRFLPLPSGFEVCTRFPCICAFCLKHCVRCHAGVGVAFVASDACAICHRVRDFRACAWDFSDAFRWSSSRNHGRKAEPTIALSCAMWRTTEEQPELRSGERVASVLCMRFLLQLLVPPASWTCAKLLQVFMPAVLVCALRCCLHTARSPRPLSHGRCSCQNVLVFAPDDVVCTRSCPLDSYVPTHYHAVLVQCSLRSQYM